MSPRDIAFGQIKAALCVLVQTCKLLDEDNQISGVTADLTQPEWRQVTAHLKDASAHLEHAGKCLVLAMNVLTEH